MKREIVEFLVVIGLILATITFFGYINSKELAQKYEEGYLQACKDFYQGKTKYQLVESKDGTRNWIKVNDSK